MEISFGLEPVLLVLASGVAGAASYLSYRGTTPALSAGRRWLLGGLRFIALTVILFLLFKPILSRLTSVREDPTVAVLVDTSESLQIENEGPRRPADDARRLLRELPRSLKANTRYFAFDSRVRSLDLTSTPPDSVKFDGQRTDVAAALESVRADLSEINVAGVVLISDGRYTSGRNPRHAAEESVVPIFTVALGDSSARRDIRISRVTTNDLTYTGVVLPIDVGIAATGFEGADVSVTAAIDDSSVATKRVTVPDDGAERSISLSFAPRRPGLRRLTVRVTGLQGEATYRNNVFVTSVRVLDRKRRVLLLGGAPDPDVSALRQILEADDNNEVTTLVQREPAGYYGGDLPEELDEIDVIVLAGFPAAGASSSDVALISSAIENGKAGLFFLARQTDLPLFDRSFSEAFGVASNAGRKAFYEAGLIPTADGRRHPVLQDLSSLDAWRRLPPVTTTESPWTVAPGARALATTRVRGVNLADPLLVVRTVGGRRTAAFLGAGIWRLVNLPEDLKDYADVWSDLLGNLIQWVSAASDDRPVRIRTTTAEFAGGDPVEFVGQIYDESLNPVPDADVDVVVTAPSGEEFRYAMEAIGSGRYVLDAGELDEGSYRYRAVATRNDSPLGEDTGSFVVGNLTLEFRNPVADPLLLRQVALRSGGAFLTPETISRLPGLLARGGRLEPRITENRSEAELWRQPAFLAVILVLLAAEWVLRKRSGLS